jgi:hypothetical protein
VGLLLVGFDAGELLADPDAESGARADERSQGSAHLESDSRAARRTFGNAERGAAGVAE